MPLVSTAMNLTLERRAEFQRDWARTERLGEVAQLFVDHAGATGSVFLWETQLLGASQGKDA